jgi:hypothetical protein
LAAAKLNCHFGFLTVVGGKCNGHASPVSAGQIARIVIGIYGLMTPLTEKK